MSKKKDNSNLIATNKKARFEYFIEEDYEAGVALEGWEVKSLRTGRVQLAESYVLVKKSEIWLFGCHMTPLETISSHTTTDPTRTRKLLMHRKEINRLIGAVERKGYTLVPLDLYWVRGRAKLKIGLAKGKKNHDKRASIKDREWGRSKERVLKHHSR